jgi:hypothetical protein
MDPAADSDMAARVRRLARPHASGGTVIERSVIIAEGSDSAAILAWIDDHHGVGDSTAPAARMSGLHGAGVSGAGGPAHPPRRFVLPPGAFE